MQQRQTSHLIRHLIQRLQKVWSKVDVTYAGKTVEIGIEVKADTPVEPEKPTVDKIAVKKCQLRQLTKKEKFDPAGLVLTVKYNKGEDKEVAYSNATKADFI